MKSLDYVTKQAQHSARVAKHSPGVLFASLLVGLGTWGGDHAMGEWAKLFTPQHIFSLVGVIGAILIGYFGGRPPKP